MSKGETVGEIYARFSNIISKWNAIGKEIPMKEQVTKILHSLTKKYEKKVMGIKEALDLIELKVKDLIGNLQTHKVKLQEREEMEEKECSNKEKPLALWNFHEKSSIKSSSSEYGKRWK